MRKKHEQIENKNIERYTVDYLKGLSIYQVNKRENEGLINRPKNKTDRTYLKIVIKNLVTFFNILLLVLGIILLTFGLWQSCAFLFILLANVTLGLVQDIRAKRMVDRLSLVEKAQYSVIREGKPRLIYSDNLVLDDIYILQNGDQVPCDSIILQGECSVNESLITGESLPTQKGKNERLLSGTYLTNGSVYARVSAVGDSNYIEQLQSQTKEYKTPKSLMYNQLNSLFKILSVFVIVIGILILIQQSVFNLQDVSWSTLYQKLATIMLPLSGAIISMIPSGMYLLASTTLTVGVLALSKEKVLVQDMYSIETIARVDTLCIDKTGTITDGTMSVLNYEILNKTLFTKDRFEATISSFVKATKDNNFTAQALKDRFDTKEIFKKISSIPFDSSYKYSAATLQDIGTIVIGANGYLPIKESEVLNKKIENYAKKGLRVLLVGYSKTAIRNNKIPAKLELIGLIILTDHIRDNAKSIISWFINNDTNVKVISGDNALTVSKIAEEVGIVNAKKYISMENITLEEIPNIVEEYNVFGRVTPEQKQAIVEALKKKKHTVAMFGDGVNDVLSLKSANVSISVRSATRAAKDIASLVLLNDDFASLPFIVAQGRRVINNLQRTCSLFLVKTIFSIILNIFFLIYGTTTGTLNSEAIMWPFDPNNFYAWEFLTIGISAFLLALEPNNERVKGNFIVNIIKNALPNGIFISLGVIGIYIYLLFLGGDVKDLMLDARTISVFIYTISSLFVLYQITFKQSLYRGLICGGASLGVALAFIISSIEYTDLLHLKHTIIDGVVIPYPHGFNYGTYGGVIAVGVVSVFICMAIYFVVMQLLSRRKQTGR